MMCRDAYLWMLSAETADGPLPPALRLHLRACRRCARRRQRLLRLSRRLQRTPLTDDPAARARIAEAVRLRASPPTPSRVRPRWPWLAAAAAAVVLIGLTAFALIPRRPPQRPPIAAAPPVASDDLLTRVVHHDVTLAAADGPDDQFQALAALAADLWAEAERRARAPGRFDLGTLAGLYARVVGEGVVGRARAMGPAARRERLPPVVEQLDAAAGSADRLAAETPSEAAALAQVASASRGAAHALRTDAPAMLVPPLGGGSSGGLLESLVSQGLRLAEEDDPLKRAACGAAAADRLAAAIVEATPTADGDEMERLGDYLAAVRVGAVDANLDRAADGLDAMRREEFDRVQRRADDAVTTLETNLAQASAAARAGLMRALAAARAKPPEAPGMRDKGPPGKGKHGPHPGPPAKPKKRDGD
jgi:hypothetical protein